MTDSLTTTGLQDADARVRIVHDLETNLLVEAGAGSGKTTELLRRMVALVRTGTAEAGEMAALTFTRKAAGELRERFQQSLEGELSAEESDTEERRHLMKALGEIDQVFIGTIHAFCARLLRERPVEAGIDPGFQELSETTSQELTHRFWNTYLERLTARDDPTLAVLLGVGLKPDRLRRLFVTLSDQPDVHFPAEGGDRPAPERIREVRHQFDELMNEAEALLPADEPDRGWGKLQVRVRSLAYLRRVRDWASDVGFFDALTLVCRRSSYTVTQNRWGDDGATKARAKALGESFTDFVAPGSAARTLLEDWQTHRYPLALSVAGRAAEAWREERRRAGHLNFQDLLMEAAGLLRSNPGAREQLGLRYRRLLVDEFQDTDPVQAEVVMLLASDPDDDPEEDMSWARVTPRPGALFVVGDPKQSIYRFRRADISMYTMVKARFEAFGAVLGLQANFRSSEDIGRLVNDVFGSDDHFAEKATPHQAEFAPLLTQPRDQASPAEGVFHYYASDATRGADITRDDAARLASWIRLRCGPSGDRSPGDFLILTRRRRELTAYAQALEGRGLPVSVSGAGAGSERETMELITLLEALVDPGDPVKTVAVLVGMFVGLDYQEFWDHREAGGSFSLTQTFGQPDTAVTRALQRMNHWWEISRREPADVLSGRILDDLGLLPYAASGVMGQLRAGSLLFALDAIRTAALNGDTSLRGALDTLATALESAEVEAPLEPTRPGAVRLMNLHKAKGLEAPVVVLAAPRVIRHRDPTQHVERLADGQARGYVVIDELVARASIIHAMPPEWHRRQEEERRFLEAEELRLMYVAATRAGDELVIARRRARPQDSPWHIFEPWLDAHGQLIEPMPDEPLEPPRPLERDGLEIVSDVREVERDRRKRGRVGYEFGSVTALAKTTPKTGHQLALALPDQPSAAADPSRGFPWGTAVHGALAAAGRGLHDEALRTSCRALLIENERPLDSEGEPTELDELVELVAAVRASTLWERAEAAETLLVETPFAVELPESSDGSPEGESVVGRIRYVEGVVDLAFRESGSWVIADYKTDVGTDPQFTTRAEGYKRQVELYASCWERLTGEPVKERIVLYTSQHRQDVW